MLARLLQLADVGGFVLGQYARLVFRDACLPGDGLGGGFIVACQQMHFDVLVLQSAYGFHGRSLDAIGYGDDGQGFRLVGKPNHRLRFSFPSRGGFLQGRSDTFTFHQAAVACIISNTLIGAFHPLPRQTLEVIYAPFFILHS